jgi:hypothetical protein
MIRRILSVLVLSLGAASLAADQPPKKEGETTEPKKTDKEVEDQIVKDLSNQLKLTEEEVRKRLKEEKEKQDKEDKEKDEKHKDLYDTTNPAPKKNPDPKTQPATTP